MNTRQTLYLLTIHAGIAIVVVAAATVLSFHGNIDAQTVSVIFGAVLGIAGASAASLATLGAAVNGKAVLSNEMMQQREQTMQQAVSGLASSPPADHPIEAAPIAPVEVHE